MKNLNWMLGLKRLYQVLWAGYWLFLTFFFIFGLRGDFNLEALFGALILYSAPIALFFAGRWIIRGFLNPRAEDGTP